MSSLQVQARALGDPTRHAIFRHLAEASEPLGVAELNEAFAFNHNAIRQHLAKLVDAGLVVESTAAPTGPGRPRLVYEIDPSAEGPWDTTGPYERLSRLLVEVLRSGDPAVEVGRRSVDRFTAPRTGDPVADLTAVMARHGFEPDVRAGGPSADRRGTRGTRGTGLTNSHSGVDIVLHRCPFATAALDDPATVCALHLGIAAGLVEGSDHRVTELVAVDPRTAGCRLRLAAAPTATPDQPGPSEAAALTLRPRTPRR